MYLMYVDESGDSGTMNSPTNFFALSSLIIHELRWQQCLEQLIDARNDRLSIIRAFADEIASLPDVNIINILTLKKPSDTSDIVFDRTWQALIQRFENTLSHRNFPGPANADEPGIVFCDSTDLRLNRLLRQMRRYNPVPNQPQYGSGYRNLRLKYILEDPIHRNSAATYFIQAADTIAYLLYQMAAPNAYVKKRGAQHYFKRLEPVLCKVARPTDPLGIVRL